MEEGNAFLPEYMDDYNRRFARVPRNAHDAHRPLRDDEDLDEIFSWQEERKLSGNLAVHYKSTTYLAEPGPATTPLAGKRVRVHEWADGRVEIRAGEKSLPYSLFGDNLRISQAAIVENKRLGAVLAVIQKAQIERDRQQLDSTKLTVREKERIRAGWAEAAPDLLRTRSAPKRTFLLCLDNVMRSGAAKWALTLPTRLRDVSRGGALRHSQHRITSASSGCGWREPGDRPARGRP